jgi:hypothetical protein
MDPPEGGTAITIHSIRVATLTGKTIAPVSLSGFQTLQQVRSVRYEAGTLEIASAPGSDDPQIWTTFSPPLQVRLDPRDFLRELPPYAAAIFAALVAILLALEKAPGFRAALAAAARSLATRPATAVMIAAAIAVIASAYPIVFLGRSHVSPNVGTTLLYDKFPTLPGYRSSAMTDPKLSDVGAVMWQHVPFSVIQHRALSQGELPLWNRYNALGVPLLGQGQSMFGDPLHFLVIAARGAAWAWDLKYLIAKWLFATGLGLAVLALVKDQGTKGLRDKGTKGRKD